MKKLLFSAALLSAALFSCTSDDTNLVNPSEQVNPLAGLTPVTTISAGFNSGSSMNISTTGRLLSAAKSRVLADYPTPAAFADEAGEVKNTFTPVTTPPTVGEDVPNINGHSIYNGNPLVGGNSYYIGTDYQSYNDPGSVSGDGDVTIYIKEGFNGEIQKCPANATYVILPGAEAKITVYGAKKIVNYGTMNVGADINAGCVVENYGTLNAGEDLKLFGSLYNKGNLEIKQISGNGNLVVDGDFKCTNNFGLQGTLYVSGVWSGHINVNGYESNYLKAHVNTIDTEGSVVVTAGAQLMVEKDVKAASMKLDGKNGDNVAQTVIKGTADITGDINVASGTKGYIERMLCENYTANASDIWVGCKSVVRQQFELNGNAQFTLANGVYLDAGSANFAADTKIEMMSNAYFKVNGKLQLNNANTNNLNGSGSELAIVKAKTIGANYEDFSNTFTGNIGVDFEAWDYKSSTGLIDQNENLKRMSDLADAKEIEESECNPGYKGKNVGKVDPTPSTPEATKYTVRYVYEKDGNYVDIDVNENIVDANGEVDQVVNTGDEYEIKPFEGFTAPESVADKTLVKDPENNVILVIYTKNATPEIVPEIPTPTPTPEEIYVRADDFNIKYQVAKDEFVYEYVTDKTHESQYITVGADQAITVSVENILADGLSKVAPEGINEWTYEVYLWPTDQNGNSLLLNEQYLWGTPTGKIVKVDAKDITDRWGNTYHIDATEYEEYAPLTYTDNAEYTVKYLVYQGTQGKVENGKGNTGYIKVSVHVFKKTAN